MKEKVLGKKEKWKERETWRDRRERRKAKIKCWIVSKAGKGQNYLALGIYETSVAGYSRAHRTMMVSDTRSAPHLL